MNTTRRSVIGVGRRLLEMGRKLAEQRSKSLRRLFHLLSAEIWSMLQKSARSTENVFENHWFPLMFFGKNIHFLSYASYLFPPIFLDELLYKMA
jgi:hypothetical protein